MQPGNRLQWKIFLTILTFHYSGDFKLPLNVFRKPAPLSVTLSDHKRTKLRKMHSHTPLCCAAGFIIYTSAQSGGIKSSDPTKVKVCPIKLLFSCLVEVLPTQIWQWRCLCCTTTKMKIVNKHHLLCWQRNCSTLNVRWLSAKLLFLTAWTLPASGLGQVLFKT